MGFVFVVILFVLRVLFVFVSLLLFSGLCFVSFCCCSVGFVLFHFFCVNFFVLCVLFCLIIIVMMMYAQQTLFFLIIQGHLFHSDIHLIFDPDLLPKMYSVEF